ncbi:unnamed protein product, partial [marine sediment metagenome]
KDTGLNVWNVSNPIPINTSNFVFFISKYHLVV